MPLVKKEHIKGNSLLAVWNIAEDIETLESKYQPNKDESAFYLRLTNQKRKKEWLIARIALHNITGQKPVITYSKHGKPSLINSNYNLSISHSKNYIAILLSEQYKPGIDIEEIGKRVEKVQQKFLAPVELSWCALLEQKTICWSAKEAIFKVYEKELDFHDVVIHEFKMSDNRFEATATQKGISQKFSVHLQRFNNNVLTYTLK